MSDFSKEKFPAKPLPETPGTPETHDFESHSPSIGSIGSFAEGLEPKCDAPPFPTECLPIVMADMVRETAASSLTPESMPAACALGVVAAALGSGLEMSSGGDRRCRGNLFILCIAESGTGKDLAFRPVVQPLIDIEIDEHATFSEETRPQLEAELQIALSDIDVAKKAIKGESDDAARLAAVRELRDAQGRKLQIENRMAAIPILVFTEPTREGLTQTLSLQAGEASACMTPESRGTFSVLRGRYSGGQATDEDIYCAAFSGTAHVERRRGREPVTLRKPCLNVLFMLQPDKAAEILADENLCSSGLLPRFLMFDSKAESEQMPNVLPRISGKTRRSWHDLIEGLARAYRLDGGAFEVELGAGVFDLMREYENCLRRARNKRDGGALADIAPFVARWAEQAWRLALVLHASEWGADSHKHALKLSTAEQALTITRWFVARQLDLIHGERMRRMHRRAEELVGLLRGEYDGAANVGELSKRNGWNPEEIRALVEIFPQLLKLERHKPTGGGRPTTRVSVQHTMRMRNS